MRSVSTRQRVDSLGDVLEVEGILVVEVEGSPAAARRQQAALRSLGRGQSLARGRRQRGGVPTSVLVPGTGR